MKKIPTLFEREFENHKVVRITDKVKPGFEWVLEGIVFWKDGQPQCKIKRTDFGFSWPVVKEQNDG